MLLSKEDQDRVEEVVAAMAAALGLYLLGRDVLGRQVSTVLNVTDVSVTSLLEDAFLAGKALQALGEPIVKVMTATEVRAWAREHVALTAQEQVQLQQLREQTEAWLRGRAEAWKQDVRNKVVRANKEYTATVETTETVDAAGQAVVRQGAKQSLLEQLDGTGEKILSDSDRLVQTEMASYFQQGQASEIRMEQEVYKIPRAEACPHCYRLHLNADGSFRIYKLADVLANANEGLPAYAWTFTIGPVHPHCYCRLMVLQKPVSPNPGLAALRKKALAPKKKSN